MLGTGAADGESVRCEPAVTRTAPLFAPSVVSLLRWGFHLQCCSCLGAFSGCSRPRFLALIRPPLHLPSTTTPTRTHPHRNPTTNHHHNRIRDPTTIGFFKRSWLLAPLPLFLLISLVARGDSYSDAFEEMRALAAGDTTHLNKRVAAVDDEGS